MAEVITVGAGIYGLVAAKTYLELDPSIHLTIVDSDSSVGGVWSKRRVYPGLYAQMPYQYFEFYDLPMKPTGLTEDGYINISGTTINAYLEEYTTLHGLHRFIRFQTLVRDGFQTQNNQWQLTLESHDEQRETVVCDKLIVANGPTSKPLIPDFPRKNFDSPVFHVKDWSKRYKEFESPEVENIRWISRFFFGWLDLAAVVDIYPSDY